VRGTGSQISFAQKANDVWYFLLSSSLDHNPQTYVLLRRYSAPCDLTPDFAQIGLGCWQNAEPDGGEHTPTVGYNFTDEPQGTTGLQIPARTLWLNPTESKLAQ
jgi:hypothetical protein